MKKIVCAALLLISMYVKAGSCSANGNGNWETPGTWSCGHVPGAGDNVTLGAGFIVTVTATNVATIGNLDIFGTLKFTNGSKINLSASSVVNIYSGGSITGGNGGAKLVFPTSSYSGPFSTTGPFYFSNNSSGVGLLPLTLVSFYSSRQNQEVILYWSTENEESISLFQIELSGDGNADWHPIETIPSMAANEGGYSYHYIDHTQINGDRYYRLKIIDRDGQYAYSKVLFISSGQSETISVTPTLVTGSINISLHASGTISVSIYNISGQQVKTFITGNEVFNMDVSRLTRGEYFLQVLQGNNAYVTKFLKQ
ncbi:MAG TPA: T9SS type A sorting domain-containing protein [Puia sp.]|nr:T9SS type A sorting domain-containing protein [Puia sp.]